MFSNGSGYLSEAQRTLNTLCNPSYDHRAELGVEAEYLLNYEGASSSLNQIAKKAVDILRADQCQILVLGHGGTFRCQAFHGSHNGKGAHFKPHREFFHVQDLLQQSILGEDHTFIDQKVNPLHLEQQEELRITARDYLMLFPMRIDTEPVGIFALSFEAPNRLASRLEQAYYFADLSARVLHRESLPYSDQESIVEIVMSLSKALEARDLSTGEHCRQITRLTERIAIDLGCSFHEVQAIRRAALLHDIGKIGIPDSILQKPGPLTEREWVIMKQHPEIGARILRMISGLSDVAQLVMVHHEHYDGTGYPLGLRGEEIPIGARILTVVDAFGAMITNRVYRPARSLSDAIDELQRCAGKDFDPVVVKSFTRLFAMHTD